jgi:hypothetical protein
MVRTARGDGGRRCGRTGGAGFDRSRRRAHLTPVHPAVAPPAAPDDPLDTDHPENLGHAIGVACAGTDKPGAAACFGPDVYAGSRTVSTTAEYRRVDRGDTDNLDGHHYDVDSVSDDDHRAGGRMVVVGWSARIVDETRASPTFPARRCRRAF